MGPWEYEDIYWKLGKDVTKSKDAMGFGLSRVKERGGGSIRDFFAHIHDACLYLKTSNFWLVLASTNLSK